MPFPLTTETWIPCRTRDGTRVELGLGATFARAHELESIYDPSPLITLALHRLLLAILHRVFGPRDLATWKQIFQRGSFDMDVLGSYFEQWKERFDLLHPERPFYQTRGLPSQYESSGLERLVFERSQYGAPLFLFEHRPEKLCTEDTLSFAEATRALLAVQTFAPGGLIKKPGEPDSASAGPLNRGACVLIRRRTLFETLLANLLLYRPESGEPIAGSSERDRPAWEQPPLARPVGNREPERAPYGWIDLLTWQSRRIELTLNEERTAVRGAVFCIGRGLDFDGYEPMLAYRKSRDGNVLSVDLSEDRAIWRDSHALVRSAGADGASRSPKAVLQIARIELRAFYGDPPRVLLEIFGMRGNQAKILLTRAERLSIPLRFFDDADRATSLDDAVTFSESVASELRFAIRHAVATALAPGDRDPDKEDVARFAQSLGAERRYWSILGQAFEVYLDDVARGDGDADATFANEVRTNALDCLQTATRSLGTGARQLQAAARAEVLLRSKLKALTPNQGGSS